METKENNFEVETFLGDYLPRVFNRALDASKVTSLNVFFNFNGLNIFVKPDSILDDLREDMSNARLMNWDSVGPYPKKYSAKLKKEIKSKRDHENKLMKIEMQKSIDKEKADKEYVESTIKGVRINLRNKELWNQIRKTQSGDPYSNAAIDYAEIWAKLMQVEVNKGNTVKECKGSTDRLLGYMGISGFQFSAAEKALKDCWIYGEEL